MTRKSLAPIVLLAAVACTSSSTPPPAPVGEYEECSQTTCSAGTCFQFKGPDGQVIGALCTTTCTMDMDCMGGGVCTAFAQGSYCLLPCPATCPVNTSCKPMFDGTRDLCFPP